MPGVFGLKMYRQAKLPTTNPPITGPAIAPTPTTVVNIPMALPRSSAGNVLVTIAMLVAWTMAVPMP